MLSLIILFSRFVYLKHLYFISVLQLIINTQIAQEVVFNTIRSQWSDCMKPFLVLVFYKCGGVFFLKFGLKKKIQYNRDVGMPQ